MTASVLTVNETELLPDGTVTVEGASAEAKLLESFITTPPDGAMLERVTVPVEEAVPVKVVGDKVNPEIEGGLTVRTAVSARLPLLAVIVASFCAETPVVTTLNVTDDWPPKTVTDVGKVTEERLLVNFTTTPASAAFPVKDTVPVEVDPPTTVVGFKVIPANTDGLIVNVAVLAFDPVPAVMVAIDEVETSVVVMANVAEVEPDGMVTVEGTTASAELELNGTTNPPVSAAAERVTVPVEILPPPTEVGFKVTLEREGMPPIDGVGEIAIDWSPPPPAVLTEYPNKLPFGLTDKADTETAFN